MVDKDRLEKLEAKIDTLIQGQVSLIKEFIKLRDNKLNIFGISSKLETENKKFVLPPIQ